MKKYMGMILMTAVLLGLTTQSHATEFKGVQNNSAAPSQATLSIDHSVVRESYFKVQGLRSELDLSSTTTKLGTFDVRNNTIDGYSVKLSTANGGALAPTSTLDGEVNLPYKILLKQSGTIGAGINPPPATIEATELANAITNSGGAHTILAKAGSTVSSATSASFEVAIQMDGSPTALAMAGTYADVITLTYIDL